MVPGDGVELRVGGDGLPAHDALQGARIGVLHAVQHVQVAVVRVGDVRLGGLQVRVKDFHQADGFAVHLHARFQDGLNVATLPPEVDAAHDSHHHAIEPRFHGLACHFVFQVSHGKCELHERRTVDKVQEPAARVHLLCGLVNDHGGRHLHAQLGQPQGSLVADVAAKRPADEVARPTTVHADNQVDIEVGHLLHCAEGLALHVQARLLQPKQPAAVAHVLDQQVVGEEPAAGGVEEEHGRPLRRGVEGEEGRVRVLPRGRVPQEEARVHARQLAVLVNIQDFVLVVRALGRARPYKHFVHLIRLVGRDLKRADTRALGVQLLGGGRGEGPRFLEPLSHVGGLGGTLEAQGGGQRLLCKGR
mmetsp:Transcript_47477/g.119575  ORF Transcript_47477/g.119575 Transcript_47477/m.119575 type:complete len:361 (+) Transcript_47477:721-1803(+)